MTSLVKTLFVFNFIWQLLVKYNLATAFRGVAFETVLALKILLDFLFTKLVFGLTR